MDRSLIAVDYRSRNKTVPISRVSPVSINSACAFICDHVEFSLGNASPPDADNWPRRGLHGLDAAHSFDSAAWDLVASYRFRVCCPEWQKMVVRRTLVRFQQTPY
jgi:hypothetical protein